MKVTSYTVAVVPYACPVRIRATGNRGRTVTLDFTVRDAGALRDALTAAIRALEATEDAA